MSRKILASLLALMMLIGVAPMAFAGSGLGAAGGDVSGEGDIVYLNDDIVEVVVPTAEGLGFIMDPQGLTDITGTGKIELQDLQGGKIVPNGTGYIINNGSKSIVATLSLEASSDDTGSTGKETEFITAADGKVTANADDDVRKVMLYAIPSTADHPTNTSAYVKSNQGFVFGKTANKATMEFVLDPAEYEFSLVSGGYTANKRADTGHGIAFQIAGQLNPQADWAAYHTDGKKITVKATYSFEYLSEAYSTTPPVMEIDSYTGTNPTTETNSNAFGLITDSSHVKKNVYTAATFTLKSGSIPATPTSSTSLVYYFNPGDTGVNAFDLTVKPTIKVANKAGDKTAEFTWGTTAATTMFTWKAATTTAKGELTIKPYNALNALKGTVPFAEIATVTIEDLTDSAGNTYTITIDGPGK